MRKFFIYLFFGALPLWAAIAIIYIGGQREYVEQDYWAIAPWLILPALAACVVTFTITARTVIVYETTPGPASTKVAASSQTLVRWVTVVVLLGAGAVYCHRVRAKEDAQEEAQAEAFVRSNLVVKATIGFDFNITGTSANRSRGEYHVYVNGLKTVVVVSASHTRAGTVMSLKCIADDERRWAQRRGDLSPCEFALPLANVTR